jgi:hypothetical protein
MAKACGTHGREMFVYRILMGKLEGSRPLGKQRHRWEDDIWIALRKIDWGGMDSIDLSHERDQWRALVKTIMDFRGPWNVGKFLSRRATWISQEALSSMELVLRTKRWQKYDDTWPHNLFLIIYHRDASLWPFMAVILCGAQAAYGPLFAFLSPSNEYRNSVRQNIVTFTGHSIFNFTYNFVSKKVKLSLCLIN